MDGIVGRGKGVEIDGCALTTQRPVIQSQIHLCIPQEVLPYEVVPYEVRPWEVGHGRLSHGKAPREGIPQKLIPQELIRSTWKPGLLGVADGTAPF